MKSFTIKVRNLNFSPGLASSLITVMLLPLFVYLGVWQLSRMEEKKAWQQALEQKDKPRIQFEDLVNKLNSKTMDDPKKIKDYLKKINYQQLEVSGFFLDNPLILINNQYLHGQLGFNIIQLFKIFNEDFYILVDRGWTKLEENKEFSKQIGAFKAKNILTDNTVIKLIGTVNTHLYKKIPFINKGENIIAENDVFLMNFIDFSELSMKLSIDILPFFLKLELSDIYLIDTQPINFNKQIHRHLGYAVQWFMIAFVVLLYYFIINTKVETKVEQ